MVDPNKTSAGGTVDPFALQYATSRVKSRPLHYGSNAIICYRIRDRSGEIPRRAKAPIFDSFRVECLVLYSSVQMRLGYEL